ncbi:MAG TPA: M12 family metallo-peptidase [Candidatus Binatia bacterium]
MNANVILRRFSVLLSAAAFVLLSALAQAQTHPNLFRQRPVSTSPGGHGLAAQVGDIDEAALAAGPAGLTIVVPGKPDLAFDREGHEPRGARSMVWRGRGQLDRGKVTLTLHEGLLYGRIESGSDVYAIRPGPNGRTLVEKINTDSFAPEWGHDAATHGHEKVPPPTGSDTQGSLTAPNATAADGTVQIVLMSVYTPQARAAAGGTTQIQAQIQAAVDQANTAFVNSNMIARYFLAHTEEVAYNDSGNIETDLNWVTSNSAVASLRNTYSADMVSLITNNGGGYCGIGWVQRNPGSSFAGYAFQVTWLACLSNSTLAHEHGHNMGMEHDPASAGISPSGASYPWSFGHYVNGAFRTIMSYDVCSISCPRVLHFSNPDVLYNGIPTGILNQRDNAQTGDSTAPIVANFRLGGGSGVNNPPTFTSDPIVKPNATQGQAYSGSIASNASDPDADPLTFAKTGGPIWLSVAANGALSGTPGAADLGLNSLTVSVADGRNGSDTATLQITVIAPLLPPSNLAAASVVTKQIDLNWTDNSAGESGFKVERSANGKSYSQITTVGANFVTFSDTGLRSGRKYYYRVRAYNGTSNSAYSNIMSATAK